MPEPKGSARWQTLVGSGPLSGASVEAIIRIGLTLAQTLALPPRLRQGIEVKPSDSRAESYVEHHGDRCWEADVLPEPTIQETLDANIRAWLDRKKWERRNREIERTACAPTLPAA